MGVLLRKDQDQDQKKTQINANGRKCFQISRNLRLRRITKSVGKCSWPASFSPCDLLEIVSTEGQKYRDVFLSDDKPGRRISTTRKTGDELTASPYN
jgi:hypothetical protein